jgi:hypothetical protein
MGREYDFIPLLEVVSKEYKLSEKILFIGYKDIGDKSAYNNFRTYDDIVNDNVNDNVSIYRIRTIIEI